MHGVGWGMHGKGVCMAGACCKGGVCVAGRHFCQEGVACLLGVVCGGGVHGGGVHGGGGHVWQGACMQERRPLECILV